MPTHAHKHAPESKEGQHSRKKAPGTGLHKDWRTWVVISLMLAAMGIYVLTLDDSIQPPVSRDGIPAASGTAAPPQ